MDMKKFWFLCLFCSFLCAKELLVDYQRMSRETFQEKIVGNTIVGITRQSRSLYMLYFREDGSCELWKQNQIYPGSWWIDRDSEGEDVVHAIWPNYVSQEPKSLFSPKNPAYGKPTSLRYYFDPANGGVIVEGKAFQAPVLLVHGILKVDF
jgi:hypothetical protein